MVTAAGWSLVARVALAPLTAELLAFGHYTHALPVRTLYLHIKPPVPSL
jgi:hypothetical protein